MHTLRVPSGFTGIHIVCKSDVLKYDVMSCRGKGIRAFRRLRVIYLHQSARGDLRHEHFRDQCQCLVERRIDTRNRQQEHEQSHKVNLTGKDHACSGKDGRCHSQPHDHARCIDKDTGVQLSPEHSLFVIINLVVQFLQESVFLIRCPDFTYILQCFLDTVRHLNACRFGDLGIAFREFSAAEQQCKCHRYAPQARKRHPPVIDKHTDCYDRR